MIRTLRHKVNEGVQIKGNGRVIDVIVRELTGTPGLERALLEIHGVDGMERVDFGKSDGPVKLAHGLKIVVRTNNHGGNGVRIGYIRYASYALEQKVYEQI